MQISMLFPTVNFYFIGFFTWVSCIFKWPENYICYFQSDVMHLTEDATKLKLFMDVLDGTKAAVRHHGITFFLVIYVVSFLASLLFFSSFLHVFYLQTLSASFSWHHPCLCLVCVLDPWWPLFYSSSSNSGEGLYSRIRVFVNSASYLTSHISNKLLACRHQCGGNSSRHPVSPLPDPGEYPAGGPADDGKNQSQNLLCTHFRAADSG